jgi:hypothetical protein
MFLGYKVLQLFCTSTSALSARFYRVPLPAARQTPNLEENQGLRAFQLPPQEAPSAWSDASEPSSGRWNYGREMAKKFCRKWRLPRHLPLLLEIVLCYTRFSRCLGVQRPSTLVRKLVSSINRFCLHIIQFSQLLIYVYGTELLRQHLSYILILLVLCFVSYTCVSFASYYLCLYIVLFLQLAICVLTQHVNKQEFNLI